MKYIMAIACSTIAIGLVQADAHAKDLMYGGTFCTPNAEDVNKIGYTFYGVHNVSDENAVVECPFALDFSGALIVKEVDVAVYDRNTSANVSCTLRGVAIDGTVIWSRSKSSAGASEGVQFLVMKPNQQTLGTMHMSCSIPANNTALGVSHVTTYRVITTP